MQDDGGTRTGNSHGSGAVGFAAQGPDTAAFDATLAGFGLVTDTTDPAFNELVRIAARITSCEKAFLTFLQNDTLHVVASVGSTTRQTEVSRTVCRETLRRRDPLIVTDLSADPRFHDIPYVAPADGARFYAGYPLRLDNGVCVGTLCVIDRHRRPHGLTDRELDTLSSLSRLAVSALEGRRRDARLRDYLDIASDWIWEQDSAFRFTYLSDAAADVGIRIEEFIGKTRWDATCANGEADDVWAEHRRLVERHEPFRDFRFRWFDGNDERIFSISGRPVFAQGGAFLGYRGSARDVTVEESARREVEHMARHDALTNVANRANFEERVGDAFRDWQESGDGATLFLLDLDHFKLVNDTLGHTVGDALLKEVARRLTNRVSSQATVARLGGDEFAVLDPSLTADGAVAEYAATICQALAEPYTIGHDEVDCGCSLGIASLPEHGGSYSQLMGNADLALYEAKASGRGRFARFDMSLRREADCRNTLARELCEAFDAGQFDLVFQPIVRLDDAGIIGAEALLRWDHPERGRLAPGAFIAALDSTRYAADVGYWVLEEACRAALPWAQAMPEGFRLSVNLFAGQLRDPRLVNRVRAILERTGFDGRCLDLEITENILLAPSPDLMQTLKALKRLGISVVLDDFGTGFGSLTHLLQFSVDRIKVDRQFVRGLDVNIDYNKVTHALVKLAVDLGLKVTAEGIETEEQKRFLARIGCTDMQGYHFCKPVPAGDIAQLIARALEGRDARSVPRTAQMRVGVA